MAEPIKIIRGDSLTIPMQWRLPSGSGIDITGYTITGSMRLRSEEIAFTVANGRVEIVDAAQGRWRFVMTDVDTAKLPLSVGLMLRVRVLSPSGKRTTLGVLTVNVA